MELKLRELQGNVSFDSIFIKKLVGKRIFFSYRKVLIKYSAVYRYRGLAVTIHLSLANPASVFRGKIVIMRQGMYREEGVF